MILKENNGVAYYVFPSFEDTGIVRHAFTTRLGGVSQDCFSQLNLSFGRGDNQEHVNENFKRLAAALGIEREDMVFSQQVHGTELYFPNESDRGKGITRDSDIRQVDGLVSDVPEVAMTTFYADCVPLFFLDPVKRVAAVSHAGWKGTVLQIGKKTVSAMEERFGCERKNIMAGIGPSIGPCCFEVDIPVADEFINHLEDVRSDVRQAGHKYFIDLWGINRRMLLSSGVSRVETASICTKCHPEFFFSHRRMGTERGSMAAIISIKKSGEPT